MADIPITREATATGGRYVALIGRRESEMTFAWVKSKGRKVMIVDHTGVPSALSGQGVGLALVKRAVEDARAEGFRILPHCSFVRVMLVRHKEWQDVLASEA
ncbi:MAG TPA: GNAT family N-acetyltransferase [Hyphomonadaceae bacterium]|nr:GNAT family N-acetyltransferase [Hyphomonadaceae bacterium]